MVDIKWKFALSWDFGEIGSYADNSLRVKIKHSARTVYSTCTKSIDRSTSQHDENGVKGFYWLIDERRLYWKNEGHITFRGAAQENYW